jgi:hypothetical protein
MPLPKSKDVGKTYSKLKSEKPNMPKKQKVAIALSNARKNGADIPKKSVKEVMQEQMSRFMPKK